MDNGWVTGIAAVLGIVLGAPVMNFLITLIKSKSEIDLKKLQVSEEEMEKLQSQLDKMSLCSERLKKLEFKVEQKSETTILMTDLLKIIVTSGDNPGTREQELVIIEKIEEINKISKDGQ